MGGTNIDGVIIQDGKIIRTVKNPTDRDNLFESIWNSLEELLADIEKEKINRINLSTTVSTNAIVENKTCPVGMIIQSGPGIPDSFLACGNSNVFVSGYIDHRGKVIERYKKAEIRRAISNFKEANVDSVAIVTKFSTRNPDLEKEIKNLLEKDFSPITMGHTVSGKLNFPRRVFTSYLNSAVYNVFNNFSNNIKKSLESKGITAPVYLLKADGGTMNIKTAEEKPVETILSGPAASFMGINAMLPVDKDAILLDIGGTTTDIFFLADGVPLFEPLGIKIDKYKTLVRSIYSQSIGLGGDSAVKLMEGRIKIGPERKGNPYAFGGPVATPTDAMIVLKQIDKDQILKYISNNQSGIKYGQVEKRAYKAMKELGKDIKLSAKETAHLILDTMAHMIKSKVTEILQEVNSKPVYTIEEFLYGKKIEPKLINIIGGPAKVLQPILIDKFNLPCYSPKNYQVANAVGAALAKPTAEINMVANTAQGLLSVPEMGIHERIGRSFTLNEAKKRALDLVEKHALSLGALQDEIEAEIIEESSFNMVQGFYTSGKNIRIRAQVKPGLIEEFRGESND